jgi:predicted transcriptional regulator
MEHGCLYSLRVLEGKAVRSPLTQGRLEIKCIVTVNWASDDGIDKLKSSIERNYSFEDHLADDSKTVLQSLKNSYEVEEEIELDFGLEVLEISETETEDNQVENVEDDADIIFIN